MKLSHLVVVLVLLCATGALLYHRGDVDKVPPSEPLSLVPQTIGAWSGKDVPLQDYVLDVLGKGIFLNRTYLPDGVDSGFANERQDIGPIGLFIGYFPTQRTGQAIHSPQNCLPGAGWSFESKGVTLLQDPSGNQHEVGDYIISNGRSRDEVLYWYRSHGRSIASDYLAKWYTLLDSIRYQRTDAALIRIITPVQEGEDRQQAHQRVVKFAENLNPLLPAYIPD
jgi:EpsI family protein